MARPNILWICSDQQRFDTLNCYGNPFVRTPNLDALAASGVQFEQAYCQNPVCTPSRASFLTGRYPRTTRARQNGQDMPPDERLISRALADEGYDCGLSGKLHLSAAFPTLGVCQDYALDHGYGEFHWSHHPYPDHPGNQYIHWLREQGQTYRRQAFRGSRYVETSMPPELHQTTWCSTKAISFIEARARRKEPWLFSVNLFDPHHAFDPPAECLQPYLDQLSKIPLPNFVPGELDNKPLYQRHDYARADSYPYTKMTEADHRLIRAAYWAMVDLIDGQVGRMIEALRRTGQLENTLVIFMSDHGEMLGDHGIYTKGPYVYDPAIRVPLIVSMPGTIPGGKRSGALVELTDLAPTLRDAAGLDPDPGMQGRSLWPMLTGKADLKRHREDVYCEYYGSGSPTYPDRKAFVTMVRTDRHKLAVAHGLNQGELYDLADDPNETRNLWDSREHGSLKADMLTRLCDRMAFTADPLPVRRAIW